MPSLTRATAILLDFYRLRICVFSTFLALLGYLMFNTPAPQMAWPLAACFFACAGVYSLNGITDRSEDLANGKPVNPLASSRAGKIASAAAFLPAFGSALFYQSSVSAFFLAAVVAVGVLYSLLRLKRHWFLKNAYSGFGVGIVFLVGASASALAPAAALHYAALSAYLAAGSMISDLRDFRGDSAARIGTLPVRFGYPRGKQAALAILFAFSLASVIMTGLSPFIPFCALMALGLLSGRPSFAHSVGGLSLVAVPLWALL